MIKEGDCESVGVVQVPIIVRFHCSDLLYLVCLDFFAVSHAQFLFFLPKLFDGVGHIRHLCDKMLILPKQVVIVALSVFELVDAVLQLFYFIIPDLKGRHELVIFFFDYSDSVL